MCSGMVIRHKWYGDKWYVIVSLNVNLNLLTDQLTALLPTSKNVQQCVSSWASGTWASGTLNGV